MVTTPNRLYSLQATGSNPGTWGVVLNNQVFGVIDLNLGGRYNVDVSGSSDVTPTATQAENIYHHLTGVLTGSINYILPATGGDYIVFNDTTGAFTVTVKPTGGTGLVVPQASTARVFIDPDAVAAVSGASIAIVSGGGIEYSGGALRRSALSGAVTAAAGSGTTALASNVVVTASITDNAVTLAKLATQATLTVLANVTGGSAVPTAVALATAIADGNGALLNVAGQSLSGGARVIVYDNGTKTTGTFTPDPGNGPMQKANNNGAHTLAPGTNYGNYLLTYTNGASAGAIAVTGWTKVAGNAFDTTNGHKFRCSCVVDADGSTLNVQAMF